MTNSLQKKELDYTQISLQIKEMAHQLGFQDVGITDFNLTPYEKPFKTWLEKGYNGTMDWMTRNQDLRFKPDKLVPGTLRAISVSLPYLPQNAQFASQLNERNQAYVSRYALGRDYHKVMRKRLQELASQIETLIGPYTYRPFVDSAPVLERPLAEKAGLGWRGKNSLILNEKGSWIFLGELLVSLPLPVDSPVKEQCGTCKACMQLCPTQAIVEEGVIDGRRCISYLTIEHKGPIPLEFREAMGNRIYGCDDCQLVCPWNRYAPLSNEDDFQKRDALLNTDLCTLFAWSEAHFLTTFEGSPIRRIGHLKWIQNIAIALGNATPSLRNIQALYDRKGFDSTLDEHIDWAIEHLESKMDDEQLNHSRNHAKLIRIIQKGLPRDA